MYSVCQVALLSSIFSWLHCISQFYFKKANKPVDWVQEDPSHIKSLFLQPSKL
uniref:Uncharacterized protein n=1 Tax=Anguilla anguilla TaxID=7936 RepID=A0A0E9QYD3_ANGAN